MKPFDTPVPVTRPSLPPLADYARGLEAIWASHALTNRGPIHERLAARLRLWLDVPDLRLFGNGALALELGLRAAGRAGEVITTPFTFAASGNAILNSGLTPVFVDVEPTHFTLAPEAVEAAVTPATVAILGVHVFGHPCRLDDLARIAARRNLLLVYDAAHAFGVTVDGRSIATFGDLCMFSFHATKAFHAVEGGALVCDATVGSSLDRLVNHGLGRDGDVLRPGTNAKMSEFHALMGDLMLDRFETLIAGMAGLAAAYREALAGVAGVSIPPEPRPGVTSNHAFMPILIDPEAFGCSRDELHGDLLALNVHARRYFHPLLSDMGAFRPFASAPRPAVAGRVADRVLTLPIYPDLPVADVRRICEMIRFVQRSRRASRPVGGFAGGPALAHDDTEFKGDAS